MSYSLVVIGERLEGRSDDVYIGATNDVGRKLRNMQRGYPRELHVLYRDDGAGDLAPALRDRFASRALRSWWFELEDAAEAVRTALEELTAQPHSHEPSYANYVAQACRHPACVAAKNAYTRDLNARHRAGDWEDRRKQRAPGPDLEHRQGQSDGAVLQGRGPAGEPTGVSSVLDEVGVHGSVVDLAGLAVVQPDSGPEDGEPTSRVVTDITELLTPPAMPVPFYQRPETGLSDDQAALAHYRSIAGPDGKLPGNCLAADLLAAKVGLSTSAAGKVVNRLLSSKAIVIGHGGAITLGRPA